MWRAGPPEGTTADSPASTTALHGVWPTVNLRIARRDGFSPRRRHHSTTMSIKRNPMRNRFVLFSSALIVFTVAVFLFEAHLFEAHAGAPEHCGFWTTIDAGLSCR
jgi:hypothetical protein